MRALVVEDEPLLRESLDDHLFQQGFTTDLAIDKREAEELLISQEYDLLLLDLSLPDGDGLDLVSGDAYLSHSSIVIPLPFDLDIFSPFSSRNNS